MNYTLTVYYMDGTSGMVTFEKPVGAHPDSKLSVDACRQQAEQTGKQAQRICHTYIFNGVLVDIPLWIRPEMVAVQQPRYLGTYES